MEQLFTKRSPEMTYRSAQATSTSQTRLWLATAALHGPPGRLQSCIQDFPGTAHPGLEWPASAAASPCS